MNNITSPDNYLFLLAVLFIVHVYLIFRFIALSYKYRDTSPYWRHFKWLVLVAFLPIIGYCLYYWKLRR